jgi:hypothetical protein
VKLLAEIAAAFSERAMPADIVPPAHVPTFEYNEALHFAGRDWRTTTCEEWESYSDSIYAFTPLAFCYFLPGMLTAGVIENRPGLSVTSSLVNMLDRSPVIEYWDVFFSDRWTLLTAGECKAVQNWILWLADQPGLFDDNALMRAFETLEILALQREGPYLA